MDPVVAIGSIAAVTVLVLLNWLIGGWSRARIADAEAACARYAEDYWEDQVRETALDADGRAALLELADSGALGLVAALGDKTVTRRLTGEAVRAAETEGKTLILRLRDFVLPKVALTLGDAEEAAAWAKRLNALAPAARARDEEGWNSPTR